MNPAEAQESPAQMAVPVHEHYRSIGAAVARQALAQSSMQVLLGDGDAGSLSRQIVPAAEPGGNLLEAIQQGSGIGQCPQPHAEVTGGENYGVSRSKGILACCMDRLEHPLRLTMLPVR